MPLTVNQIQNAYVAFFNRPADTAGLTFWSSYAGSSSDLLSDFAKQPEYTSLFTGLNSTQSVNLIYNNLFGRDADLTGLTYWVGQLTSGKVSIANIADAVNKGALGTDATIVTSKTTAATSFTTNLDTTAEVIAYSAVSSTGLAAVKTWLSAVKDATTLATAQSTVATIITTMATAATATTTAGSTFTLTTGTNTFTGTTGDDTFDGGISSSSLQTLNSGDSLDGGAGNDTLYAVITGSVTPSALKNIENINVTNTTTAATMDFSNATGLSAVANAASTVALTMSGISKSGPTVTVRDTAIAGQVVSFNDVTGTADSATVVISNVTGVATLEVAGVETLTLQPTGTTANVLATLTTAAATKLNVTGSAALNVGTLGTTVVTLDASTNTGTSNVGVTAVLSSTGANTITGGSANDAITVVSTGADSIAMGAGNDTFTNVTGFNTQDTIDGGAGTDTLLSTSALVVAASAATPTTYTVTNIETIAANTILSTGQAFTPANISATATRLNLLGAGAGAALSNSNTDAYTVTGPAGAFTLGLGRSQLLNTLGILGTTTTLAINDTGTAITDSITILNSAQNLTTGAQLAVFNTVAITSLGYETVTINNGTVGNVTQVIGAISLTGDLSANTTLALTGANTITTGAISASIIDASALTAAGTAIGAGTAAFQMSGVNTATTITGSAGIDNLIGHASTATSITAGAGADSITAGTGNDTVLGGAGNDSITAGSGNDSIDAGDGNDLITMAGNLASGDVINGGAGTDTITASSAILPAAASTISNIEIVSFSATASQAMSAFLNAGVTTLGVTTGTLTVTEAQTNLTSIILGATGASVVTGASLTRLVDGTADSLSVLLLDGTTGGTTLTTASFANEETLTIGESGTDSATAVTFALGTVTATALTTLTVTGSNNHSMTLAGNTLTTTINASAATGTFNLAGNAGVTNQTITGSATNLSTIVGGTGNDSITGGALADTITAGAGADTVIGGAGDDTIVGGAGADSFVGGDGTDTLDMNYTLAIDGGSVISTGYVINIGSSAVTATVVNAATATGDMATDALTVAVGTVAILTGTPTTGSTRIDTVSGFENIIGSSGEDYIIGSSSANEITALGGLDIIFAGSGDDNINVTVGTDANTDVINGEGGTDTLVITTALTYTQATDASLQTVEQITLGATASIVLTGQTDGFIITGGAGINSIAASSIADTITDGAGADLIASAAGADTITLATDAAADTLVFGNVTTLTGGADLAFGALAGSDTITGFTGGVGGDILQFDQSGFGLAGVTEFVGLVGALTQDSSDEIVVLTAVGYATDELAEDAIAARVTTDGLDMVFIYFNTTDSKAHIVHDTDAGVDGAGTTTLVGTVNTTGNLVGGIATDFLVGNLSGFN